MKKDSKVKIGALVTTALLGLGQIADAESDINLFIPLEDLTPQERQAVAPKLEWLDKSTDWEKVIVGVDKNGDLVLRDRETNEFQRVAEPSCWPTTR